VLSSRFSLAVRFPICLCVIAAASSLTIPTSSPVLAQTLDGTDDYWPRRDALNSAHADRLEGLADRCVELALPAQAETTRAWIIRRDPGRQYLFLPPESDPAGPADDAPTIVRQWYNKFSELRKQHAEALYQLATAELDADRPARTYQLLHEVLHENPDHEAARHALGYRKVNDRWRRPEGVIRVRPMQVANRTLGFRPGEHWVIESGSFHLTTDHSEEAGRRLVERLEELRDLWRQLFFRYHSNAAALARRLEGNASVSRSFKRHKVVLFRDRQEYVDFLQRIEPRIAVTVGYYMESQKTAYFYVDDQPKDDTYFHEVTHQLFSETGRVIPGVGLRGNAWIIEGVAMYMESLRKMDHHYTAGGMDANRLQYARYRALGQGFYVPLGELVALGRQDLQQHEDIRRLYSQSAGLATMLIDYRRGVYRQALVDYLRAVYQGRDRVDTLASVAGVPLADLDEQYEEFLNVSDADLVALAGLPPAQNLSLGRTSVTDRGMQHLKGQTLLEWLDVGYTNIGDDGLAAVRSAERLNHLIAEHTRITDAALETISHFRDLEILDLTGTAITDNGLTHLRSLSKLKELWIGDTAISDAGLVHLHGLRQLETLDVGGTNVTLEGWNRLKNALPSLNTEATASE
jgi:hypothetical protein